MRKVLFALLTAGTLTTLAAPAEASGGCGPYGHRTYYGACAPGGQFGFRPRPYYRPAPFYFAPRYGYGWHRPHRYFY